MPFFVFNNILASFVLFFVFLGPRFSPVAGLLRFSSRREACPRQCVHKMTTIIGYHIPLNLSRENCKKLRFRHEKWIPAFAGMTIPGTRTLKVFIPAKAGIHRSDSSSI